MMQSISVQYTNITSYKRSLQGRDKRKIYDEKKEERLSEGCTVRLTGEGIVIASRILEERYGIGCYITSYITSLQTQPV